MNVDTLPYGLGRRWLTLDQVSEWMSIPESTLRGLVDRRSIPYRKVGQSLRFPEAELEEWSRRPAKPGVGREIPLRLASTRRARRGERVRLAVTYDDAATP